MFENFTNEEQMSLWDWSEKNTFDTAEEFFDAGKKAGFKEKDLKQYVDDIEQGGDEYVEWSKKVFI